MPAGRPSIGGSVRDQVITIRVTKEEKAWLEKRWFKAAKGFRALMIAARRAEQ